MKKKPFQRVIKERLQKVPLFVVSDREPNIHNWSENWMECLGPASGLTVALDPVMRALGTL